MQTFILFLTIFQQIITGTCTFCTYNLACGTQSTNVQYR